MQADPKALWQYIAKLRPRLRGHVQLYPQVYRGERWYVLHDQSSGQYLRLSERAYAILGRLNGELTLEEILEYANMADPELQLSEEEVIGLIGQLNAAEVLRDALPVNVKDMFGKYKAQQRKKRQYSLMNPLSIKVPLFDPDRLLTRLAPLARILFSNAGLWFWLVTVLFAFFLALANMQALISDISVIELSPQQLIILWLIYPMVKAMHELGHGLAVKAWGGEVHEVGINLLVFMPVPYVDATASWGFRNKWRRMAVGAAGIFTELFLAALALFVWLSVEPGLVRQAALNVMLIATLSTLLFNGNPLLRYDGYFVFEDWLEIPNLATRAKRYYYYLIQKYILGLTSAHSPVTAPGEEKWFLLYGFASPLYRLLILLGIARYLIDSFLVLGVALAVWVVTMQLIVPLVKGIRFLAANRGPTANRLRGFGLIGALFLLLVAVLFIPVPTTTYTQGVVWTGGEGQVVAGASGFVKKILAAPQSRVKAGQPLLQLVDPELMARHKELKARLNEVNARLMFQQRQNRAKAGMIKDDLRSVKAELAQVAQQIDRLTVYSHAEGKFVLTKARDISGHYVRRGEILGHIVDAENLIIRAVVPQSRIGLLETYKSSAEFKLAGRPENTFRTRIIRETPQATTKIPSPALGTAGGGTLAVDPNDESGTKLLKPIFLIDLSIPKALQFDRVGSRVYVRLEHGYLPVGEQLALMFNQLFLRHFYGKEQ
ncbi:efflux RND transporter periplasmic adaptor subunit [Sulfurovum sp.]|uniref:efflux RND transporter periplasmic adaptor subunit n=1 Tax=Sulfurovum sp. TaxID=1969726 RepID=UPI0025CF85ED|nr:efflux RND transporter periplasmic adaptor subunit [Sulfurovum sp.]